MLGHEFRKFSEDELLQVIQRSCGAGSVWSSPQAIYLGTYLANRELNAQSILIEADYVDRHWLDEYQGFYANRFRPSRHTTTRLHFFSSTMDASRWDEFTLAASNGRRALIEASLSESYLGFMVVRPLESAPIGRTVLRPYRSNPSRHFETAESEYRVHIGGLELTVKGLPFQQQDRAVGACATTAMWSALARVMRMEGDRPPTPFQVTEAATHYLRNGRPYPNAKGLEQEQMLEAVRRLGFSPVLFQPAEGSHKERAGYVEFLMALLTYLRSGIPVVLTTFDHAVVAAGFRESDAEDTTSPFELELGASHRLRFRGVTRMYLHDDRLGPYGRFLLRQPNGADPVLEFDPKHPNFKTESLTVSGAIAPLYPKIRLTATELIGLAAELLPLIKSFVDVPQRDELFVTTWFSQSGRYLRRFADEFPNQLPRLLSWFSTQKFPRYTGIVRFEVGQAHLLDVVCDTTDMRRETPKLAPVLAIICGDPTLARTLKESLAKVGVGASVP